MRRRNALVGSAPRLVNDNTATTHHTERCIAKKAKSIPSSHWALGAWGHWAELSELGEAIGPLARGGWPSNWTVGSLCGPDLAPGNADRSLSGSLENTQIQPSTPWHLKSDQTQPKSKQGKRREKKRGKNKKKNKKRQHSPQRARQALCRPWQPLRP